MISQIRQPAIIVFVGDKPVVIPVKTLRDIANGRLVADNETSRAIALALLERMEDDAE